VTIWLYLIIRQPHTSRTGLSLSSICQLAFSFSITLLGSTLGTDMNHPRERKLYPPFLFGNLSWISVQIQTNYCLQIRSANSIYSNGVLSFLVCSVRSAEGAERNVCILFLPVGSIRGIDILRPLCTHVSFKKYILQPTPLKCYLMSPNMKRFTHFRWFI
jgi:hypothetical protein